MDFPISGVVATVAAALGTLAFFGGIALMQWVDQRGKTTQRQLEHAERLRALELGQELPDAAVARAAATSSRARAAASVGVLVPAFVLGSGVGATALILVTASANIHLPLLCVIWGVCGLVSLVAVSSSLSALKHQRQNEPVETKPNSLAPRPVKSTSPLEPHQRDLEVMSRGH